MQRETGISLENQARKAIKPSFFDFLSSGNKDEESARLFKEAGSKYVTEKKFPDAMRCFNESNMIYKTMKTERSTVLENLRMMIEYGKEVLKRDELIALYKEIGQYYSKEGGISNISKYNKQNLEISSIYEKDDDYENALKILNDCVADPYTEDNVSEAKVRLLLKLEQYEEVSNTYKKMAEKQLEKKFGNIIARKNILMSVISGLVASINFGKEQYEYLDRLDKENSFERSTEGRFIISLLESLDSMNVENFEIACGSYDRIVKLTVDQVSILIKVKQYLTGKETIEKEFKEPNFN